MFTHRTVRASRLPAALAAVFAAGLVPLLACGSDATTEPPKADSGPADVVVDAGPADTGPVDASCLPPTPTAGAGGDLAVGKCAPDNPCGGSLEKTAWTYTSACGSDPTAAVTSRCPAAVIHSVTGKVSGTIQFACGQMERNATSTVDVDMTFPKSCLPFPLACAQLAQAIPSQIPGSTATCIDNPSVKDACDCQVKLGNSGKTVVAYKVVGTQIQTADESFDFCVEGTTLRHGVDGAAPVQANFTATKL